MLKLVRLGEKPKVRAFIVGEREFADRFGYVPERDRAYFCVSPDPAIVFVSSEGEKSEDYYRRAAAEMVYQAESVKIDAFFVELTDDMPFVEAFVEGLLLSGYSFDEYRREAFDIEVCLEDWVLERAKTGILRAEAANYVRDLVNRPPGEFVPESFLEEIRKVPEGVEIRVWRGEELKEAGFVGTYSVGKGSANDPVFIHASYRHPDARLSVSLVGKGITFDAGGLSLKPPSSMETMKMDKAGACAVLGAFKYAVQQRLPLNVDLLIPAAENLPDGSSYKPDDILRFRNGVSVEIHSTDAEGRLLLADALCYASELGAHAVVDVATLTGACVVALGKYTSGLFTTSGALRDMLLEASQATGEKMWEMPLDEDLEKELKTDFADTRNNAKGRYGGAITAALFLKKFVSVDHWAHIDIAGPAFLDSKWKYYRPGATGQPVRSLILLLEELQRRSQL